MTFEELAVKVADDFRETMDEQGFESFDEMKKCYWWDSNDIKEEVNSILSSVRDADAYIDEIDGSDVILNGDTIPYRKFSAMWHKCLKANKEGGD